LPGYLLFWLLTGIGGGAIVLLRDLVIGGDARVYERFKIWEAVGHVLGIAFFLAGLASANLYIPVLSAVLAGLGCAVVAIWAGRTFQGFVSKHEGDV
jgi:hypothetical protein